MFPCERKANSRRTNIADPCLNQSFVRSSTAEQQHPERVPKPAGPKKANQGLGPLVFGYGPWEGGLQVAWTPHNLRDPNVHTRSVGPMPGFREAAVFPVPFSCPHQVLRSCEHNRERIIQRIRAPKPTD